MDAIYARQSVEKADSLSIQGQIDLCRREAAEPVRIYQDRGFSGKNTNRPAFQRLMEDVEKGLIQKIVVYRLDRFSRSIADFGRLWEILQEVGVELVDHLIFADDDMVSLKDSGVFQGYVRRN